MLKKQTKLSKIERLEKQAEWAAKTVADRIACGLIDPDNHEFIVQEDAAMCEAALARLMDESGEVSTHKRGRKPAKK